MGYVRQRQPEVQVRAREAEPEELHEAHEAAPEPSPPHADVEQQVARRFALELEQQLAGMLTEQGYNPPQPSPLLQIRAAHGLLASPRLQSADSTAQSGINLFIDAVNGRAQDAFDFVQLLEKTLTQPTMTSRAQRFLGRIDPAIDSAVVSLEMPSVSATLREKMSAFEHFVAEAWCAESRRAIISIHADLESESTIVQIGIAEHGPLYITIPTLLTDEVVANRSLTEIANRLQLFAATGDPMAVINGSHQNLNFTQLFRPSRVLRAPSGNLQRLSGNFAVSMERGRLEPDNTIIMNSAPHDEAAYRRVFADDPRAMAWGVWKDEAREWDGTATTPGFLVETEASRETFLRGLAVAQNVVVIWLTVRMKRFSCPIPHRWVRPSPGLIFGRTRLKSSPINPSSTCSHARPAR